MITEKNQRPEIDWDLLDLTSKRAENKRLSKIYGGKVYCHESYAEDLCKLMAGIEVFDKELKPGMIMKMIDIHGVNDKEMNITLEGLADAIVKLDGERKFFAMLGLTQEEFTKNIKNPDWKSSFLNQGYHVKIEGISPYNRASLYAGQTEKIKNEFMAQITENTSAYYGRIVGKNHGGFIINVQGIDGFLPGSLAATNIVRDFDEMIGKEIPVMVEDYLRESSTFVFSYKKYISKILPQKIEELDRDKQYTGSVTGTAKYGIFIEFDEIFTGLIHASKMTPELKEEFKNNTIKAGRKVTFWIKEITADKKIILTDEDPTIRQKEIAEFRDASLGAVKGGEVISVQPFGTLVRIQKDIVGMISQKEIKVKKKKYSVGDKVMVTIDRVSNDKIYLTIPNEA
jgi:predicted RNA-binding protein with RPS1 domain